MANWFYANFIYIQEDEASDYMNQAEDSTYRREYCLDKL